MSLLEARRGLNDIEEYSVETVDANIIVNANETNYDVPVAIKAEILRRLNNLEFNRYPPIKAETLAKKIAEDYGVDESNVKIGNGSSELLQMACFAFGGSGRRIAFPSPSFSMYGVYTKLADSEAVPYPLDVNGYVDADLVIEFCKEKNPALLIVCNPNNPTGNYNPLAVMEKILANVSCPVIMDEAYMEFAKGDGIDPMDMRPLEKIRMVAGSTLALLNKYSNFAVFRTFSKAYGAAGLRCGYGIGSTFMMKILGKALLPYHVNALTLAAAEVLYDHKGTFKERIETTCHERDIMATELKDLGFQVWDTSTNFVLCRPNPRLMQKLATLSDEKHGRANNLEDLTKAGKYIFQALLKAKILVRDYTAHPALTGSLRISVGTPEENKEILRQIRNVCWEAN